MGGGPEREANASNIMRRRRRNTRNIKMFQSEHAYEQCVHLLPCEPAGIATVNAGTSQSARRTKWMCPGNTIITSVSTPADWLKEEASSPVVAFFPSSSWRNRELGRTTAACRHCAAAIQTHKVCVPKSKSGFSHMGHMHVTPHWQHELHITQQSAASELRSEARLTFHAKWSVRGMNAHLCFHEARAHISAHYQHADRWVEAKTGAIFLTKLTPWRSRRK